jgi:hypothetical protein
LTPKQEDGWMRILRGQTIVWILVKSMGFFSRTFEAL